MSTPKEDSEFSAIAFIRLLEKAIARINRYPITTENFVIQQDVFKRLAALDFDDSDQSPELFSIFATLECSRKERDTDMRFALEFCAVGFFLSAEGAYGGVFIDYEHFKDEGQAVRQVMALLKMLSNGQLAVHITTRNDLYAASEVLLFAKQHRIPVVLSTEAKYKWWWRKKDETQYESVTLRNSYPHEQIVVPKDFFILEKKSSGELKKKGRTFQNAELTPLTKKIYGQVLDDIGSELIGARPDESNERALARHWEFWAIGIGTATLLFTLAGVGILPHFLIDNPFVVLFISMFAAGGLGFYAVKRKLERQGENAKRKFGFDRYEYETSGVLLVVALLVSTFLPIYVLFDSSEAVSYWTVVQSAPVALLAPALFAAAFVALWFKGRVWPKLFAVAIVLGVVTFFIVNGVATKTDVETPEPYTTLAVCLYLTAPFLAPFLAYNKLKMSRNSSSIQE